MTARTAVMAVLLAAGKGTRMRSPLAKMLHRAEGLPLLEHVLRAVRACGIDSVCAVLGHQADAVAAAVPGLGEAWVLQDPPRGTGHALLAARERIAALDPARVLVLNGDLPLLRHETIRALLEHHQATGATATLLTAVLSEPGAYGRVLRDGAGRVRGVVEARDADPDARAVREINAGAYVFETPALLEQLPRLEARNAQGEYYLTDVIAGLAARGVEAWSGADAEEVLGVNTLAELADVDRRLRARRLAALLDSGAVVEDPSSVRIDADAVVEPGARIRPFSMLEGRTAVRAGAVIGPFARLVDTDVGPEARVLDHCVLLECRVGAGASVGPFAHVRPATDIGARARVGNFVELKNTRLGDGSKAPHLSYLGDATIGESVNVGAGTITCNYDGAVKHPTHIGSGAFVGSHATLVAPVKIGAGAYVAAGSVVTRDVPEDALAVGRSRQVIKDGWARRRRESRPSGQGHS